jgi:hypothetical protein
VFYDVIKQIHEAKQWVYANVSNYERIMELVHLDDNQTVIKVESKMGWSEDPPESPGKYIRRLIIGDDKIRFIQTQDIDRYTDGRLELGPYEWIMEFEDDTDAVLFKLTI